MSNEYNNFNAQVPGAYSDGRVVEPSGYVAQGGQGWQQTAGYQAPPQQAPGYQVPPQQAPYMPQAAPVCACGNYVDPTKKSRKWIVPLIITALICVTFAFSVTMCSASLVSLVSPSAYEDATFGPTVAVIELSGEIDYNSTACSPEGLKALLDEAADDSNIVAVVLRVNSGGGVATAGEEMTTYLRQFKEDTGKPVVVSSASMNASAAYEISSQADYIFTAKSTAIGSIGTAMQVTDYSELLDMLGISIVDITSAESKDSSYGVRPLTPDEIAFYQHQVDQINQTFIEVVAAGRHMTVPEVAALANGLAYTGIDAVENGLADDIGTLEDAMDKAAALAGVSNYSVYELSISPSGFGDVFGTILGSTSDSSRSFTGNLMKEYSDAKSIH